MGLLYWIFLLVTVGFAIFKFGNDITLTSWSIVIIIIGISLMKFGKPKCNMCSGQLEACCSTKEKIGAVVGSVIHSYLSGISFRSIHWPKKTIWKCTSCGLSIPYKNKKDYTGIGRNIFLFGLLLLFCSLVT